MAVESTYLSAWICARTAASGPMQAAGWLGVSSLPVLASPVTARSRQAREILGDVRYLHQNRWNQLGQVLAAPAMGM